MALYIGTTLIPESTTDGVSIGTTDVSQIYVGTNKVWERQSDVDGTAAYNAGSTTTSGGTAISSSEYSVSSYSPGTGNYSNGTAFTQTQSYYIQTNYSNYVYTTTRTCLLVTSPTGSGAAGTCVNPANAIGGTDVTSTSAARASTGAGPYYRYRTAYGTGGPVFSNGDASFSGSCSSVGTNSVTASGASIQALSISPASFALQSSARTETISFTYRPANGYYNSGTTFSGSVNVTVPASLPTFSAATWTGVVSVTAGGSCLSTAGNGSPIAVLTSSYPTVATPTSRNVTVQVTIPAGYQGFGTTMNITKSATQPATVSNTTATFNIVDSISGATVNSVAAKTGPVGNAFSFTVQATASAGFTFNANSNASTSSSPSGLGAGSPSVNTSLDTWSRVITGSYPASNTTYTITVSGSCPADVANTISVSNSNMTFAPSSGSGISSTVTTGPTAGAGFSASDNRSWITTSISGNNVNVFCSNNTGSFSTYRSGTVTVSHSGGGAATSIFVEQNASGGGGGF